MNRTRVVATYDFTRIRAYLNPETDLDTAHPRIRDSLTAEARERMLELRTGLLSGRSIDWDLLEPALRVPHDSTYRAPQHEHGTHVAGVLAADWRTGDADMPDDHDQAGMCPDLELYDLRVLDEKGQGDEFTVIAALQFVRHLNAHKDELLIHGVNLSLSIRHDVANYACGRTPVCEECERLVGSGVVVVAAAGNEGYAQYLTSRGSFDGYRSISITDPGNAEGVITVGATHRYKPHTFGVSYFSSRGPTGDGRYKPDLVAPGEKIKAPVPDRKLKSLDGTSMAAPHVSGAAALLLARHRELVGQPTRVKQILCKAATDLGRERYFQGSGMLDVLRALQAV
jgi:subtilisin family serine protease